MGGKVPAVIGVLAVVLAACASGGAAVPDSTVTTTEPPPPPEITPPVGEPMLPDLMPEPPVDLLLTFDEGRTIARFSSTLVNVGEGDFVLRGERLYGEWTVSQELWYSESGAELIKTDAKVAWGGDGHDHWHIKRVANYWLVPLDEDGNPVEGGLELPDSKIGFCFFDLARRFETGPEEYVYYHTMCGHEDAHEFRMGLSPGWADVYDSTLPGQEIDITDVEDGMYRVWAEADSGGWFTEADTSNNLTWVNVKLFTRDGVRYADIVDIGPSPED
ncbi:MAG TPA: lysyl oxidase family protein [Acidimicrobiia bacterium]|nr:lysyl oxidase family protein [Acidimicrobiia bacterium]